MFGRFSVATVCCRTNLQLLLSPPCYGAVFIGTSGEAVAACQPLCSHPAVQSQHRSSCKGWALGSQAVCLWDTSKHFTRLFINLFKMVIISTRDSYQRQCSCLTRKMYNKQYSRGVLFFLSEHCFSIPVFSRYYNSLNAQDSEFNKVEKH